MNLKYEYLATGRKNSILQEDIDNNKEKLQDRLSGSKVAIIGAAGSIGSSVVKQILNYSPKEVVLFDLSENNLVELVRDLRSSRNVTLPSKFTALPIGLGSLEFEQYFKDASEFDYIFNLCAIKHVRSEKDVYSIKRMVDTNILFLNDFLDGLPYSLKNFFSVSSDKAVSPANVMGATKLVMEEVLNLYSDKHPYTTARFANVAFSDGSLPFSFFHRINKEQPIVAPSDIKRYFISHEEAGQLCLLAGVIGENRETFFPKLVESLNEKTFEDIARELLKELGYTPYNCRDENEAKIKAEELIANKQWPCLFIKTDTTGEKPFEEFFDQDQNVDWSKFQSIGFLRANKQKNELTKKFISQVKNYKLHSSSKSDYVNALKEIVPGFQHEEKNKNLDQKM